MHLFGGQQEAAEDLLAMLAVAATRETAQVTAQVFEPAFPQVGGAQAVPPSGRESEEGQHLFQLELEFLGHLWRRASPARAKSTGPVPRLPLVLRLPNPPELSPELT